MEPIVPFMSNDELMALLDRGNAPALLGAAFPDTRGGAERVNENTRSTGVTAYKDAKGQTTLTNEKIIEAPRPQAAKTTPGLDADGYYTPDEFDRVNKRGAYASLDPTGNAVSPGTVSPGTGAQVRGGDTPLNLAKALDSLIVAKDPGEARALFSSITESVTAEIIKLRSQAIAHASVVVGIPALEQQLAQTEITDKNSHGWYPGIGDSPITQKVRAQIATARRLADEEAKNYLATNLTYNVLSNKMKEAERHMTRIETRAGRLDDFKAQKEYTDSIRDENKREEEITQASGLTNTQVARLQVLFPADFSKEDNAPSNVKAYRILARNKDKDLHAAVNAEGEQRIFLSLKGNQYATAIVAAEEARNTGVPVDTVKEAILQVRKSMMDPVFMKKAFAARNPTDPKKADKEQATMNQEIASLDLSKKDAATDQRILLAMDYIGRQKQASFVNDLASWNTKDPLLATSISKAFEATGKRDIANVAAAYVGSATGAEFKQKLAEFERHMWAAHDTSAKSIFGKPDPRLATKAIAEFAMNQGFLSKMGSKILNSTMPSPQSMAAVILPNLAFDLTYGKEGSPINPQTGKPFGER